MSDEPKLSEADRLTGILNNIREILDGFYPFKDYEINDFENAIREIHDLMDDSGF